MSDNNNGVEDFSEEQMKLILAAAQKDDVIVPLQVLRKDVDKIKAVKVSDLELEKITNFQEYLFTLGYIPENSFASLFVYMFNLSFTLHRKEAEIQAKKENNNG